MSLNRTLMLAGATILAAGCTSMPLSEGKYLVYRDTNGNMIRQFDYPNNDMCKRVEAVAGTAAKCQIESLASRMQAQASLRYTPPGMTVQGHYPDLARCQNDTKTLADGIRLVAPCSAK